MGNGYSYENRSADWSVDHVIKFRTKSGQNLHHLANVDKPSLAVCVVCCSLAVLHFKLAVYNNYYYD